MNMAETSVGLGWVLSRMLGGAPERSLSQSRVFAERGLGIG